MKRFFALLGISILIFSLSGCDSSLMNIDGVLSPPSLTIQQNAIYEALTKQVGADIQLCYPQTGDYRSAFIIKNLDEEPSEEAIVFYQSRLQTNRFTELRVNILDQRGDGSWVSACDITGAGYEVDRVEFGDFGPGSAPNIIVGYKRDAKEKKVFSIYSYAEGMLTGQAEFEYDIFALLDLPGLKESRLVYIGDAGADRKAAKLVAWSGDGYRVEDEVEMYGGVYHYQNVVSGMLSPDLPALFLDGRVSSGICTQILSIEEGKLVNLTCRPDLNLVSQSLRTQEIFCSDIDRDGIVEVPSASLMPGFRETDPNPMYYTDWLSFGETGYSIEQTTFINAADGYRLSVPEDWKETVSAAPALDQAEVQFYRVGGGEEPGDVLLQIRTVQRTDVEQNSFKAGFFKLASVGQITYMAKLNIETDFEGRLTKDGLVRSFSIIL